MLKRKKERVLRVRGGHSYIPLTFATSKVLVSHGRFWFFMEDSSSLSKILEYWMINPIWLECQDAKTLRRAIPKRVIA
jgi:hypothetical protein